MTHNRLIETQFVSALKNGDTANLHLSYSDFTCQAVSFCKSNNHIFDIHTALVVVEVEIEHIIELANDIIDEIIAYAKKAIKFIKNLRNSIAHYFKTPQHKPLHDSDTAPPGEYKSSITWTKGPFKLIELILGLYIDGAFDEAQLKQINKEICRAFNANITESQLNSNINKMLNRTNESDTYALYLTHLTNKVNEHGRERRDHDGRRNRNKTLGK